MNPILAVSIGMFLPFVFGYILGFLVGRQRATKESYPKRDVVMTEAEFKERAALLEQMERDENG